MSERDDAAQACGVIDLAINRWGYVTILGALAHVLKVRHNTTLNRDAKRDYRRVHAALRGLVDAGLINRR